MSKYTAIVLAAGSGKRMNTIVHKQYLLLDGKPILYYSLKAFEDSRVSEIVLVTGDGEEEYCQKEIIQKYGLQKVCHVVKGGKERYHSVYEGLKAVRKTDYVLIHDGARPFIDKDIIERSIETVEKYQACVVGMPAKDTIKIADELGFAADTPDRERVWQVQTPQTFSYSLIMQAYEKLMACNKRQVTDDAMVLEQMTNQTVKLIEGSYRNIKITTPEDLLVAETYLK